MNETSRSKWTLILPVLFSIPSALLLILYLFPGEVMIGLAFLPFMGVFALLFFLPVAPGSFLIALIFERTSPLFGPLTFASTAGLWILYGVLAGRWLDGKPPLITNSGLRKGIWLVSAAIVIASILGSWTIVRPKMNEETHDHPLAAAAQRHVAAHKPPSISP